MVRHFRISRYRHCANDWLRPSSWFMRAEFMIPRIDKRPLCVHGWYVLGFHFVTWKD